MKSNALRNIAWPSGIRGVVCAVTAALLFPRPTCAQAAGRQVVHDHVPAIVRGLQPVARYPGTNQLNLAVGLPLRNLEALTNLLRQIYDPASPNYRHYLTPEKFTERFGPTEKDYQGVIAFAQAKGLRVTGTHPNRMLVDVTGSVADIEKALHLTMRVYRHPTENRLFHAPEVEPSLDMAVPVLGIRGLDDYSRPHPCLHATPLVHAPNTSTNTGSGFNGTFLGKDFRAAYVPNSSLNGTGQVVGLLEFDGYTNTDIAYYENLAGLHSITLSNVFIDGSSGYPNGTADENLEVCLDIDMAISMATNASMVVVYMAPNPSPWEDLLNRMANDNVAEQLSCSWQDTGGAADPVADQIFQQMAAQGQSFFTSSGDSDAYTGLIGFPDDTPYTTQVGGTTLTTSGPGGSWVAETVWNWGSSVGSGGGISTQYPIPSWQQNINMAYNQGSTTMRNTPDVALTAANVYVRAGGVDYSVGGTSCAAPLWAGFVALANQLAVTSGEPVVGFINAAVDGIGTGAGYTSAFHDITTGNNTSFNSLTKFYAVSGYDLCTGWGTPSGQDLINALVTNDLVNPEVLITPVSGFSSVGPVGGTFTITSQNLALTNLGRSSLSWTLVNTSLWLNAFPSGGTLTPGGPAAAANISLNSAASNLSVGTYSATVWITNLTSGVAESRQFTLNIGLLPVITAEPTNQTVLAGSTTTLSVAASSTGPSAYQWQFNGANLPNDIIATVAGNGTTNPLGDNGEATNASLDEPYGAAVDSLGNLFIADLGHDRIRKVDINGNITTEAGNGSAGYSGDGGAATNASLSYPDGVAVDNLGNVFIADLGNNRIRKVDVNGNITTVAGNGNAGYSGDGGAAVSASLDEPYGVAVDGLGNLFIADTFNNRIRQVDTSGIITTLAGNGSAGYSGDGGAATNASLDGPYGVAVDSTGNLFIADTYNNRIRQVDTDGIVTTVAGNSGTGYSGDGGAAVHASLSYPFGVVVDGFGNLFIADTLNDRIRQVNTSGVITTVAGDGGIGYFGDGGVAANASLDEPYGATVDGSGNLFIADTDNNRIREVALAGSPTLTLNNVTTNEAGSYSVIITNTWGSVTSTVATLTVVLPPAITSQPQSLTAVNGSTASFSVTVSGTAPLVCQWQQNQTNLSDGGNISGSATTNLLLSPVTTNNAGDYTVIISNAWGSMTSSVAALTVALPPGITSQPQSLTVTNEGSALFSVTVSGTAPLVCQWQENQTNLSDGGNISGSATTNLQLSLATTNDAGNYAVIISNAWGSITSSVALLTIVPPPPEITQQPANQTVASGVRASFSVAVWSIGLATYQWQLNGSNLPANTITTVAGDGSAGYSGDGGAATNASLDEPYGVAVDGSGNIFISDLGNNRIRKMNPSGAITTVAGNGSAGYSAHSGPATNASLYYPCGVAVDNLGDIFIADLGNNRIRKVNANGIITTVAGNGRAAYSGDGGVATNASLNEPYGVAVDGSGNIFIADLGNNRIRKVNAGGIITTVAGNGSAGYSGDGGAAINASLDEPYGVAVDSSGDLFIADTDNNCIRIVNASGIISTVAGNGGAGYSGDGGAATNASLDQPYGVAVDGLSNLFIAELGDNRIRQVDASGFITTVAGNGSAGYSGDGGAATNASLDDPYGVASDGMGNLFIADTDNNRIRHVALDGSPTLTLNNVTTNDAGNYTVISSNAWGSVTSSVATLTVVSAPVITSQPQNLTVINGGPAGFSVTVSGTAPLVCQWQENQTNLSDGGNISGSATTNLLLSVATTNDAGNYTVIISNAWGSVTSTVATLTVVSPPVITSQPQSLTVANGGPAGFSVTVSGTAPLVCQWQENQTNLSDGGNISGSDTTNLLLSLATTNDAGNYTVIISNAWGSVTSSVATLTVALPPVIISQPQSLTAPNGSPASFSVTVSGTAPLACQWQQNQTNLSDGGNISGSATTNLLLNPITPNDAGNYTVIISNPWGCVTSTVATLTLVSPPIITTQPQGLTAPNGSPASFSVAVSGTAPLICQWQENQTNLSDGGNISGSATTNLLLSLATTNDAGNYTVIVSNVWGSVTSSVATLTVSLPPVIISQPQSLIEPNGNPASFSVAVSGAAPLVCQWQENQTNLSDGGNISGSATTNLLLNLITPNDAGNYTVIITNVWGSVTSTVATLTLVSPPIITTQPQSLTAPNGSPASFSVAVSGAAPLVCQWQENQTNLSDGGNISGSATTNLLLNPVTTNDAGNYTVMVSNVWGSVTSSVATLTVSLPPVIISQPQSLIEPNGSPASFSVAVSGAAPLVCQWQENQTNLSDGGNISGSATTNLLLNLITPNDAGNYTVIITNVWGSVTSSVATLTLALPPVITSQPQSLTVTNGSPASFSVTVSGTAPLVCQWQENQTNLSDGGNISGSATTNLLLSPATTSDAGNYTVIISNAWGSVTSSVALLTIANQPPPSILPPVISQQPTNQTVMAGGMASFSVTVSGTAPLVCQWQENQTNLSDGGNISGSDTTNLLLSPATTNDAGNYTVIISNAGGSVTSSVATLAVVSPPVIISQPQSLTVANGSPACFSVTVSGTAPLVCQWQENQTNLSDGGNISGSATTNLLLSPAMTNDAGNYTVIISNAWGSVTSSVATLTVALPPGITSQPQSLTVTNGGPASFIVAVSGTAPLACQWQQNQTNLSDGGNISGSATTNLVLIPVTTNDAGNYTVIISNTWGSVTSSPATLTLALPPVITNQPQSLTVTNGGPASFSVAVSGTAPLVCQWQQNQTNLSDGGNISGSATTNLVLSPVTTNDAGNYTVIISNAWGNVTSSVALLTIVMPPPEITQQSANQAAPAGGRATFSVAVWSTGPATYQWQFNGSNLPNDIITTEAGSGSAGYFGDGGAATNASLDEPYGVAVDGSGNVFIADLGNNRIRQVDANGIITTVAGNGSAGYSGDGGAAVNASLDQPYGVAVDISGNIFIADFGNNCIRQVDTNGIINTVAGDGTAGYSGDGGAAVNASLDQPYGVAVDGLGNLFIADLGNNCIRQVDTNGTITTVAGDVTAGYSGDGGAAVNASLDDPYGVAADGLGNLFIADLGNSRIRQVDTNGIITTVAGDGSAGYFGDGGAATNASLDDPYGVAVDGLGNLFIADTDNNRIREAALAGSPTLTLNNVTTNNAGNYTVIISNAWGSVTSSVATLTIVIQPVITQQPTNQTVVAGGTASFSLAASGAQPLIYQWSFNGTNISGATNTSLILSNVQFSQAGTYMVLVTNLFGSSLSSNAMLIVTADHFTWEQIPSPRFANTPFSVTIEACNMTNGILTNFTGAAFLDTTNGVTVSPALSGEFLQGVWTGTVMIPQTASNLVLQADDGAGHFGLANPINVVALPPLTVRTSGNKLLLLWPVSYSGFVLEASGSLSPTAWTPVTVFPTELGNQYLVLLPISGSGISSFYRLQLSGP